MTLPTRFPVSMCLGTALGLLATAGILRYEYRTASSLQQFYLGAYVRSAIVYPKLQPYWIVTQTSTGMYRVHREVRGAKQMHVLLGRLFYRDGLTFRTPLIACGSCLLAGILMGAIFDGRRRTKLRNGVQVGGRRIVSTREFNKRGGGEPFFLLRVDEVGEKSA